MDDTGSNVKGCFSIDSVGDASLPVDEACCPPKGTVPKSDAQWNVIVVALVFLFLFMSDSGLEAIETSLQEDDGVGSYSLALLYLTNALSAPIALNIQRSLGSSRSLLIALLGYWVFLLANATSFRPLLLAAAVCEGFSSALLWVSQSVYIMEAAQAHSQQTGSPYAQTLSSFSGIFYAIYSANQLLGNGLSFALCSLTQRLFPSSPLLPGSSFTAEARMALICAFAACMAAATAIAAALRNSRPRGGQAKELACSGPWDSNPLCGGSAGVNPKPYVPQEDPADSELEALGSSSEDAEACDAPLIAAPEKQLASRTSPAAVEDPRASMWLLLGSPRFLALLPLLFYAGCAIAFVAGAFTRLVAKPVLGVAGIGGSMAVYGAAQMATCLVTAKFSHSPGSIITCLVLGVASQAVVLGSLLLYGPPGRVPLLLLYAVLMGIGEAVFYCQVEALVPLLLPEDSDAAYAQWNVWSSLGISMVFAATPCLGLSSMLMVMFGCSLVTIGVTSSLFLYSM